ncbi:MAG TPA: toll/interleukin-1 receptor domain-containing protein [Thermoanaerobaculia bacterium]|nr:toll/interleukin-1 receptor domain-containing protein [Thermoanaerobaculia bacterium]
MVGKSVFSASEAGVDAVRRNLITFLGFLQSSFTMSGIFISYRRSDSSGYAHALNGRLTSQFGRRRVFMDVDSIEPGRDFIEAIDRALSSCSVFLVLIGPRWAADGHLGEATDFVRLELEAALARQMRVIPVLLDGTEMPHAEALPESLRPFIRRHAVRVAAGSFKEDADKLVVLVSQALKRDQVSSSRRLGQMLGRFFRQLLVFVAWVTAATHGFLAGTLVMTRNSDEYPGLNWLGGFSAAVWTLLALATVFLFSNRRSPLPSRLFLTAGIAHALLCLACIAFVKGSGQSVMAIFQLCFVLAFGILAWHYWPQKQQTPSPGAEPTSATVP